MDTLTDHEAVKTFKIHGKKPNPCITAGTPTLMKTRYHWRNGARKTCDPIVWRTYWDLRQEVKREIQIAEKDFFADQILRYANSTNNIWKMIRQFPKSTKRTFNSMDDETIAEDFNEDFYRLFVSIGQSTVGKIHSLQLMNAI